MKETQCWHCEREANKKKNPKPAEKTILEDITDIKTILGEIK